MKSTKASMSESILKNLLTKARDTDKRDRHSFRTMERLEKQLL